MIITISTIASARRQREIRNEIRAGPLSVRTAKPQWPGPLTWPSPTSESISTRIRGHTCSVSVLERHMLLFSAHHGSSSYCTAAPAVRQVPGAPTDLSWENVTPPPICMDLPSSHCMVGVAVLHHFPPCLAVTWLLGDRISRHAPSERTSIFELAPAPAVE